MDIKMESVSTKPLRVMIVEDELVNRKLLQNALSKLPIPVSDVKCADSLNSCFILLDEDDFDVVLLDLNLPDSEGLNTLQSVSEKYPHLAIVVITGEYSDDFGLEAVVSGAQEYLLKGKYDVYTLSKSISYATERKRAEEEKRRTFLELEKAHNELKEMQSQLIQNEKMASIGQLAAGVAHEMNNPVGFVAGNFQALESYMKKILELLAMHDVLLGQVETSGNSQLESAMESLDTYREDMQIDFILDDIKRLFEESKEGLDRTVNIIQNLRDFSRIDQPGSREEYNLNDGIRATLIVARNEIKYDTEVKTELGKLPQIHCHSGQINQVILNILVNAAQAIKSQEREEKGIITIKTYAIEDKVTCEISDDGPGIPPDKISKVFDPFFTTKPPGKGTGLGLSVSYDIVKNKHDGELFVDSTAGKGTKFTMNLPISTKENEEGTDEDVDI
jgi:signal transduction histidine kinase